MPLPRFKDSKHALRFENEEIRTAKEKIEKLTGTKIDKKKLRRSIEQVHSATKAFRRLQELRKGSPVIMGRDAMLANQTFMWDDINRWIEKTEALCDELDQRIQQK